MNSLQRDEELKRLADLISKEAGFLREAVRKGHPNHADAVLGYIRTEITEYFANQKEPAR